MGKTKNFDFEWTENLTSGRKFTTRPTTGRALVAAGRGGSNASAERDTGVSLGEIVLKLKMVWVSFWYRFHAVTLGLLRGWNSVKLASVLAAGYFLLFSEPGSFLGFGGNAGLVESAISPLSEADSEPESPLEIGSPATVKKKVRAKPATNYSPVSAEGLPQDDASVYVQRFARIAQAEAQKFGIPASICLAQGLVESRAGTSTLARKNNNHFGIKCFARRCPPGHCTNHSDDHHKDFFRKYGNAWESWRAHSEMLASGRYASLKKHGMDYRKWAYGLKALGYATDANYAEKIIGMVERYQLNRFDN